MLLTGQRPCFSFPCLYGPTCDIWGQEGLRGVKSRAQLLRRDSETRPLATWWVTAVHHWDEKWSVFQPASYEMARGIPMAELHNKTKSCEFGQLSDCLVKDGINDLIDKLACRHVLSTWTCMQRKENTCRTSEKCFSPETAPWLKGNAQFSQQQWQWGTFILPCPLPLMHSSVSSAF